VAGARGSAGRITSKDGGVVKRVKRLLVGATLSVGAVVLSLAATTGTALGAGSAGAGSQHMARSRSDRRL
jgi:hypothetical protein